MRLPTGSNYVKTVHSPTKLNVQIVIPKNFLKTDRLKNNINRVMNEVKNDTYDFWVTLASQRLNKTRDTYINNLYIRKTDNKNIIFELTAPAVGIERGHTTDMKPHFAASSKLEKREFKIPKHKVQELNKPKSGVPTLIIPIDSTKNIFRTFSLNQMNTDMWIVHNKGVNLIPEVKKQLKEEILPKRFSKYVKDSLR